MDFLVGPEVWQSLELCNNFEKSGFLLLFHDNNLLNRKNFMFTLPLLL